MYLKWRDRLFSTFLLLILGPTIFICFLFYDEAEEAVFELYETNMDVNIGLVDERLLSLFQSIQKDTDELANRLSRRMTEEPSFVEGKKKGLRHEWTSQEQVIQNLFERFSRNQNVVGNIVFLSEDGRIFPLNEDQSWNADNQFLEREQWGTGESRVNFLTKREEEGRPKSFFIEKRLESSNPKAAGLLLVEINLNKLTDWVRTYVVPKEYGMMVLSPSRTIIIHTDKAMIGNHVSALPNYEMVRSQWEQSNEKGLFSLLIEGKDIYVYRQVSEKSGGAFFEWLPRDGINERLQRLNLIFCFTLFIVVLFACFVAHRLSKWIGEPIYSLVSATDSLLKGDFSVRVPIQGMKEITLLENKFNTMAEQMHALITREREYSQQSLDQIVRSFYLAVEMKDPYTAGHSERVTHYALIIYDYLQQQEQLAVSRDDLRYAGLMHDIGKVAIPDHVLLKTGKLSPDEYECMKTHSIISGKIVEQIENLSHISPGVRHHHERWDGKGYPDQLKGEEIPLIGRILAVADTFDAMTSTRSYRKAMSAKEAYEEIMRCQETQFDPSIVSIFKKAFEDGAIQITQSADCKGRVSKDREIS
ncbi:MULTISPECIES: HD domain-containing phosphohydrolase [Brevibacillus]|uniref:HD domain-containing phosphohydrolase n=1 Tax=Brevibacillus TaxID=55080 RepID=UPI000D0F0D74|nr:MULTISPECIES: HD domain-containing phosphohydrolase [Brevibacillus]MED1947675.1 HD domain-containing protein [Brevibacillus formosus]MED2000916.1 HD domain-containing protein [Brevibacillus formosus]MED2085947.1 HD domain-containing protein [Brevibacillus formosus]PSK13237.1 c-di-GMP phosphodiesterase [Brevibacillus sp. NRRL NRS-603]